MIFFVIMKINACLIFIFAHSNTNYNGNWRQGKFHFGLEPGAILHLQEKVYTKTQIYQIHVWNMKYIINTWCTLNKVEHFSKKHDVFFIRDVIPLEEQYSLDRNKVLLYTAGAIKNISLSKNCSNNFVNFSKCIWTEAGSLILRENKQKWNKV